MIAADTYEYTRLSTGGTIINFTMYLHICKHTQSQTMSVDDKNVSHAGETPRNSVSVDRTRDNARNND